MRPLASAVRSIVLGGRRRACLGIARCQRVLVLSLALSLFVGALAGSAQATHSSSDLDGDGWSNAVDICPAVYNERGLTFQMDQDLDGVGDACDSSWWPTTGGSTGWELAFYFVDGAQEPVAPSTCATVTVTHVFHYGPPYNFDVTDVSGPDRVCLSNGSAWYHTSSYGSNITSLSRTFEISCDAGGILSGSLPDATAT